VSWRNRASCFGLDPNLFHEEKPYHWPKAQLERAKAICATCPVTDECRDYAIENHIVVGVYGGLTYRQRMIYRQATGVVIKRGKRNAPLAHGTEARYQRHLRDARNGTGPGPCVECKLAHANYTAERKARANA